jgi:hypothetical protein
VVQEEDMSAPKHNWGQTEGGRKRSRSKEDDDFDYENFYFQQRMFFIKTHDQGARMGT